MQWSQLLANASLPIHLDLGCGDAAYLQHWARTDANVNFVGAEIREQFVVRANRRFAVGGVGNARCVHMNLRLLDEHVQPFLASLPSNITAISNLYPDPFFKRRQFKRRVLAPSLLSLLASVVAPGTPLYFKTDVAQVFDETLPLVEAHADFALLRDAEARASLWSRLSPTNREQRIAASGVGETLFEFIALRR